MTDCVASTWYFPLGDDLAACYIVQYVTQNFNKATWFTITQSLYQPITSNSSLCTLPNQTPSNTRTYFWRTNLLDLYTQQTALCVFHNYFNFAQTERAETLRKW